MMYFSKKSMILMKLLALAMVLSVALGVAPDQNDQCEYWASIGECNKNPNFMTKSCATSCENVAQQALKDAKELIGINSFFDLSADDIHGKTIEFSKFQGQVTIVVNVASFCGYTDSHYKGLVELFSHVQSTGKVNILAFPCNQFGQQEPESNESIEDFATRKYGVEFTMMSKIDVNGPDAHKVYKFLKKEAGPATITWNFATYFVISPDGSITSHTGIEPMQLNDVALNLLAGDEL